jgi:hypothetical protein
MDELVNIEQYIIDECSNYNVLDEFNKDIKKLEEKYTNKIDNIMSQKETNKINQHFDDMSTDYTFKDKYHKSEYDIQYIFDYDKKEFIDISFIDMSNSYNIVDIRFWVYPLLNVVTDFRTKFKNQVNLMNSNWGKPSGVRLNKDIWKDKSELLKTLNFNFGIDNDKLIDIINNDLKEEKTTEKEDLKDNIKTYNERDFYLCKKKMTQKDYNNMDFLEFRETHHKREINYSIDNYFNFYLPEIKTYIIMNRLSYPLSIFKLSANQFGDYVRLKPCLHGFWDILYNLNNKDDLDEWLRVFKFLDFLANNKDLKVNDIKEQYKNELFDYFIEFTEYNRNIKWFNNMRDFSKSIYNKCENT